MKYDCRCLLPDAVFCSNYLQTIDWSIFYLGLLCQPIPLRRHKLPLEWKVIAQRISYYTFAMKERRRGRKTQMRTDEMDCLFPYSSRHFPAVPHCFERCTYAIIFAKGSRKDLKQQTITKYDYELLHHYGNQLGKASG